MTKPDIPILAGLATAPVWAIPLTEINEMLTTASLVLAIILALGRVYFWIRDRNKK
jgi:membrane protein DedA with SNARE-associated domain